MSLKNNEQTANYWANVSDTHEHGFWDIPGWREHQNVLASGKPAISWFDVMHQELRNQGKKPGHALSLGCGDGHLERKMIDNGVCTSIEGCDISSDLIKKAEQNALRHQGQIRYFIADLNRPNFKRGAYDLIIGTGIFHHVEKLERLFENLKLSLKPGGKLLLYDYVGPSRFQWSKLQTDYCNQWLKQLPKEYRTKKGYPAYYCLAKRAFDFTPLVSSKWVGKLIEKFTPAMVYAQYQRLKHAQLVMDELIPPHPDQFIATDPSEAIRSSEILPILKRYFVIEKQLPLGGTLAQPLFGRTVANFLNDKKGAEWAARILEEERKLVLDGSLPSDFVAVLAK